MAWADAEILGRDRMTLIMNPVTNSLGLADAFGRCAIANIPSENSNSKSEGV